jgi:hypothetical protein
MKPLNANNPGCDPISSNCVIWQGPDIECIKLCKGDTVSDVVNKLALELCEVLDTLDLSTYNLPTECFAGSSCNPSDFHALIQILIDKICALQSSSTTRVADEPTGCPDCIVNIAPCFYYTNQFGDLVTTMLLGDYAITVGNKVCDLVNQITLINTTLINHEDRITVLENEPPPTLLLPQVTPVCVLAPPVATDMTLVLSALEQQFCQLVTATGSPNSLYQSILKQCAGLNTANALGPYGGTMSGLPGWITSTNTVANTINNMWLTICDLRAAVANIQENCCPSGCDGIDFLLQAAISGPNLTLYFTGTIPAGFTDCAPLGSTFKVTDSAGSSISQPILVTSFFNDPSGYTIDLSTTPVNQSLDMVIHSDVCLKNGTDTCTICVEYVLSNQANCPVMSILVTSETSAMVSFTAVSAPGTYTLEIWDAAFSGVIQTQSIAIPSPQAISFTVTGLLPSTSYNARLVVTIGTVTTDCPYAIFTTLPVLCLPPSSVSAAVQVPVECTTCGTAITFVSLNP